MTRRAWQPDPPARGPANATWRPSGRWPARYPRRECEWATPRRIRSVRRDAAAISQRWVPVRPSRRQRVDADAAAGEHRDRLRARMHAQRLEDRADVDLDRSLREREVAADELVRLALDHELQHIRLTRREPELARRDVHAVALRHGDASDGRYTPPSRTCRTASSSIAGIRALRDEALGAGAKRCQHRRLVVRRGQHDNRHARVVELEVAEKIEAARPGQARDRGARAPRRGSLSSTSVAPAGSPAASMVISASSCGRSCARAPRRSAGDRRSREFSCASPVAVVRPLRP